MRQPTADWWKSSEPTAPRRWLKKFSFTCWVNANSCVLRSLKLHYLLSVQISSYFKSSMLSAFCLNWEIIKWSYSHDHVCVDHGSQSCIAQYWVAVWIQWYWRSESMWKWCRLEISMKSDHQISDGADRNAVYPSVAISSIQQACRSRPVGAHQVGCPWWKMEAVAFSSSVCVEGSRCSEWSS